MTKSFIFGISGLALTSEEAALFQKYPPIGFILFSRNIESKDQVIRLTKSLKALFPGRDTPIFIDQEGGRVMRIKPPVGEVNYPPAKYFADLYVQNTKEAIKQCYDNHFTLMNELKSLSIDSPNAPMCDLLFDYSNNIIGDRSFGSALEQVIDLCESAIKAIQDAGGLPWVKHIPGHGRATMDSHINLPVINASLLELEATDFKVFKELAKIKNVWAMTAHIIFDALDPDLPVTLSKKAINYIRRDIGFDGTLVSDDINMYALYEEDNLGTKYEILKQLLDQINNGSNIDQKLQIKFQNYFSLDMDFENKNNLFVTAHKLMSEIKPKFIEKLLKNTYLAFEAGCDIVLHCSGDYGEMQAILERIK